MTYYRVCGLSLLLTAIALSGCSSLAKKSEVVTPLDNSTVNTSSTTDTTDSSTASYNIASQVESTDTDTTAANSGNTGKAGKAGKVSKKKSGAGQSASNSASGKNKRVVKKYSVLGQPEQAVVYFPFDSDELSAEDMKVLQEHLTFLQANPTIEVVLKGHSDERGTVNYNLALGEKRANAVRAFFMANGIKESRIDVVSFGETKPVAEGHNEAAWAKNRRVGIVYP